MSDNCDDIPSFDDLPELDCPLTVQPTDNMCVGDLVRLLTYNMMVLERMVLGRSVPSGVVSYYAGGIDTIPAGYLICDGSKYSSSAYPTLANRLGNLHGWVKPSDGCFYVPNLLKTIIVGADLDDDISDDNQWQYTPYQSSESPVNPINGTNEYGAGSFRNYLKDGSADPYNNYQIQMNHVMLIPIISTGEVCQTTN